MMKGKRALINKEVGEMTRELSFRNLCNWIIVDVVKNKFNMLPKEYNLEHSSFPYLCSRKHASSESWFPAAFCISAFSIVVSSFLKPRLTY